VNRGDDCGSVTGREVGTRVSRLILRSRVERVYARLPTRYGAVSKDGAALALMLRDAAQLMRECALCELACAARLLSMRAGEGGAVWRDEATDRTRAWSGRRTNLRV